MSIADSFPCYVYKSQLKADTYVYLARRDGFDAMPSEVAAALGTLSFVLEVELTPERKLAREQASVVIGHLRTRGFHLQFPPTDPVSGAA